MKIALDFDGTITADELFWARFCALAKQCGHHVTIVTARHPDGDNRDVEAFIAETGVRAIYTKGESKCRHFKPDVWIDDMPEMIVDAVKSLTTNLGLPKPHDWPPPPQDCLCYRCWLELRQTRGQPALRDRMFLCSTCGNKRCPHANDHRNVCTGSNEPGQPGSAYP
jgi:hypothetical protein